jgi:hypothetical protein
MAGILIFRGSAKAAPRLDANVHGRFESADFRGWQRVELKHLVRGLVEFSEFRCASSGSSKTFLT